MLEILKANHAARLQWRARRKQEAHRGRAVLRAAKRALGRAAVRAVREGRDGFKSFGVHAFGPNVGDGRLNWFLDSV